MLQRKERGLCGPTFAGISRLLTRPQSFKHETLVTHDSVTHKLRTFLQELKGSNLLLKKTV